VEFKLTTGKERKTWMYPEIPDSSKWSSNISISSITSGATFLKYQIPVSGVQTRIKGGMLLVQQPEIPDSSKWSSNKEWKNYIGIHF